LKPTNFGLRNQIFQRPDQSILAARKLCTTSLAQKHQRKDMNIKYLALGSLAALMMCGCEEKPIVIPPLEASERRVLIEELTGVRCTNCPDGALVLQSLVQSHGEGVIIVGLHAAAGYVEPYPESQYDFRSTDATTICNYLFVNGDPGAPAASIDRRKWNGEDELFTYRQSWPGYVSNRVASQPATGLFILPEWDAATREVKLRVNITPEADLSGDLRLSVYITEDSIRDVQLKLGVKVPDYMHRHVFRDAVSSPTGDPISEPMTGGQLISRTYSTTLPPEWVAERCSIVAFLHRHGGPDGKEVLQADEKHVTR
jgi:Outer membrane protein Omp28